MKTLNSKHVLMDSIFSKKNGIRVNVHSREIKLRTISSSERKQERISSYQYLLP